MHLLQPPPLLNFLCELRTNAKEVPNLIKTIWLQIRDNIIGTTMRWITEDIGILKWMKTNYCVIIYRESKQNDKMQLKRRYTLENSC